MPKPLPGSENRVPPRLTDLIKDNRRLPMARYFRRLARASLAASVVAAAGCPQAYWPEEVDGFSPVCASADGGWKPTAGWDLPESYDFGGVAKMDPWEGTSSWLDTAGERCAAASDTAACEASVVAALDSGGRKVILTRGDEVFTYTDGAAFLGPVNTPAEAALVVWLEGYDLGCDDVNRAAVREVEGGFEVVATRMTRDCDPIIVKRFVFFVSVDGEVTELNSEVIERSSACVGRRPAGFVSPERPQSRASEVARYLSGMAGLEAAAVHAFRQLADELRGLGAPPDLVARAEAAAEDEVRHANAVGALARRRGADEPATEVHLSPLRSAYGLALDNAVEGCVRETFGALVGTYQSLAATDPEVANEMRTIAIDETRHAELSWDVDAWLRGQLTGPQRAEIAKAQARAVTELRQELGQAPSALLESELGLPSPSTAIAMLDQMVSDFWN